MKKISKLIVLGFALLMGVYSSCFAANICSTNKCSKKITQEQKVPSKVYRLVKLEKGIPANYSDDMNQILDSFWNEPNGKLILNTLCKNKVKIKVVKTEGRVYASEEEVSISYSPSTANQGDMYKLFYITVAVPANYISDYSNKKLSFDKRLYSLGYILHELAHAYVFVKDPHNTNSIEQKLTLTMFGYNEANKIITGSYLSKEQSVIYTDIALKSIVDYENKKFPIYSGITKKLTKEGIKLQNTEDYTDITALYKKLLSEGKVKPNASFPIK